MKKSIVLAKFDDHCTEAYMDPVLGIRTHKLSLNVEVSDPDRPIYKRISKVHQAMYEAALGRDSQVKFLVCDYLPHHKLYKQVMVVSKCYIKKNTVIFDVGGHHFPIAKDLIITGTLHCL